MIFGGSGTAAIAGFAGKVLDKIFPDPEKRAQAQAQLLILQQKGELRELEIGMSAILAEANSDSAFTSSARPAFMYVFYLILIVLGIVAPILGIWFPDGMTAFYANVKKGFDAIPPEMWATFTCGYLGYTGAREYGKQKKRKALENPIERLFN